MSKIDNYLKALTMSFSKENPHIDKNTLLPVIGQLTSAINWERDKELKKREKLTKSELDLVEKIDDNFSKKMQSATSDL